MTTVLNIPVTAVAIVKSVYIANNSTGAVTVNCDLRDNSASTDVEFLERIYQQQVLLMQQNRA